ncbi:hypothetical protein GWI33_001576 [Rhynchophorus ferrugineus]|uniref:Heparan-alpha-glucosaminide N-acetyltransferase n=1 Tax=Rhynchophorus ferrugineus TaxID=354439 RepID=A0A834MLQ4_RHYFE|nr:hypothetical protein GWI33_001576 [Rhynchophorus ferrugineus]
MLFKDRNNKCLDGGGSLSYDEACLTVSNQLNDTIDVLGQYLECHKCKFQTLISVKPFKNGSILVNTRSLFEYYWVNSSNHTNCRAQKNLFEHYQYGWNITSTNKCEPIYIIKPADNAYLPILMAFVILFCFGTFWYMAKCIYKNSGRLRRLLAWSSELEELKTSSFQDLTGSLPLVVERPPSIRKHPHRIKSIDAFRGFCIILMIFINYGGGRYWFFQHSVWNGLTTADLVFPWFMWIMGLSLIVSLQNKLRRSIPRRILVFHVIRRSLILIFLGIVINSRILEIIFTKRIELENISCVYDITQAWAQWLFVLMLVTIHNCVTFAIDVPNCGKGYLGPGGLDDGGSFFNCTGGVAGYVDRQIFGNHLYKHAPCQKVYENTVYFDPEGLLGTLSSVLTVYFGVQAGRTLNTYQSVRAKTLRWVIWGVVTTLLGAGLCTFSRDDGVIPLNKQLWSLSFALVTGGLAFIIFAFLFVVVDILRKWGGRPFFYPGMNAIFLYVGHELLRNTFPFGWIPTVESHSAYLFMNLWGTALWVAISIYLYKHDIFFTI